MEEDALHEIIEIGLDSKTQQLTIVVGTDLENVQSVVVLKCDYSRNHHPKHLDQQDHRHHHNQLPYSSSRRRRAASPSPSSSAHTTNKKNYRQSSSFAAISSPRENTPSRHRRSESVGRQPITTCASSTISDTPNPAAAAASPSSPPLRSDLLRPDSPKPDLRSSLFHSGPRGGGEREPPPPPPATSAAATCTTTTITTASGTTTAVGHYHQQSQQQHARSGSRSRWNRKNNSCGSVSSRTSHRSTESRLSHASHNSSTIKNKTTTTTKIHLDSCHYINSYNNNTHKNANNVGLPPMKEGKSHRFRPSFRNHQRVDAIVMVADV